MTELELGLELTRLQKEQLSFMREIHSRKKEVKALFASHRKYKIGFEFQHPKYGLTTVIGVYIDENLQGQLGDGSSLYGDPYYYSDENNYYKPEFMYTCEVHIESLGKTTTNIPEWGIDKYISIV